MNQAFPLSDAACFSWGLQSIPNGKQAFIFFFKGSNVFVLEVLGLSSALPMPSASLVEFWGRVC